MLFNKLSMYKDMKDEKKNKLIAQNVNQFFYTRNFFIY